MSVCSRTLWRVCFVFFVTLLFLLFVVLLIQRAVLQTVQAAGAEDMPPQKLLQHWIASAKRYNTLQAKAVFENRSPRVYHECFVDLQQKKFLWVRSDSLELESSHTLYKEDFADTVSQSHVSLFLSQEGGDAKLTCMDDFTPAQWDTFFSQTPFGAPLHFHELLGLPKPAYAFMESLSLSVKWQTEANIRYAILFAESQSRHFEVWFDSQNDYMVKKFIFHAKERQDMKLGVEGYVYEVHEFGSKEEFFFPRKIMTELSMFESEVMVHGSGNTEPQKVKLPARTVKKEISFYDVKVNPPIAQNSFRFKKTVPDYTQVPVINKPQIRHVWLDGEVVLWTDELALARLRNYKFIPGVREPRFWMMASGIIMIIVALGIKTRQYFQNRKGA